VSVSLTTVPAQVSAAVTVAVLATVQQFGGTVELTVNCAVAPGAREAEVKTTLFEYIPAVTMMLVSVTLPSFRTVPV
jgi:hypothetical protein